MQTVTHWWEADDYTPADVVYCLEKARELLDRLCGSTIAPLPVAGEDTCPDCGRTTILLEYGHVTVCRRCASCRARAAQKDAA